MIGYYQAMDLQDRLSKKQRFFSFLKKKVSYKKENFKKKVQEITKPFSFEAIM